MTSIDQWASAYRLPPAPAMSEWAFVEELAKEHHERVDWKPRSPASNEADLSQGVRIIPQFPDPDKRLETAYLDLDRFFRDVNITNGTYEIVTEYLPTQMPESYVLDVTEQACRIQAGDTEGIRRGLYFLQDEILRSNGSFLKQGIRTRKPGITLRITRCPYGPKNRPPVQRELAEKDPNYETLRQTDTEYRDELLDDFDYYPDAYLSRLARDAVNGLWITDAFRDLCTSTIIPEYGQKSEQKLKKLRHIVDKCARYGIRVFIFCLEPRGFSDYYKCAPKAILEKYPELSENGCYFCTSKASGKNYLEEATYQLFSQVPGLGGLIHLCVGEMPTHCSSWFLNQPNPCPICSKRPQSEVLAELLEIINKAMHRANPEAKLIAWPYSQYLCWGEELTRDFAAKVPEGVILQHNFESAGKALQLGKERSLDDYWLAWTGPSKLFADCARIARAHHTQVSAKIQVGCAHEVSTVPCIPVPGILYEKFKAMNDLDVTVVMEAWLTGSFPSVMTWAAGELSFLPSFGNEEEFLLHLARRDWGEHAETVVEAWRHFQRGFRHFPYGRLFTYYSPANNGIVWPLYLKPRNWPLSPHFKKNFPLSGDRIGECIADDFTWDEVRELCGRLTEHWNRGVALLKEILPKVRHQPERVREINVALAGGIQFQACRNILEFYYLRDKLAWETDPVQQKNIMEELKQIVFMEQQSGKEMLELAQADSRLGFHGDCECHIYFPVLIEWRLNQLQTLLDTEFPEIEQRIQQGQPLLPEYTGQSPQGKVYHAHVLPTTQEPLDFDSKCWASIPGASAETVETFGQSFQGKIDPFLSKRDLQWKALADSNALYIKTSCHEPQMSRLHLKKEDQKFMDYFDDDAVEISIEPRSMLWPWKTIRANARGSRFHFTIETPPDYSWKVQARQMPDRWELLFHIPWSWLGPNYVSGRPIRINVRRFIPVGPDQAIALSWVGPVRSMESRLMIGSYNPQDLGWLLFRTI